MSEIISLKNISISFEPIEILPDDVIKVTEDLENEDLELNDLKSIIFKIENLINQYPNLPSLTNIKLAAHSMISGFEEDENQDEKLLDDMIVENYKKFPNFLTAKCNYADLCLRNNKINEFLKIFDNKLELEDLYPGRKVFHFYEALMFYSVVGQYYCLKNDFENAEKCLEALIEIDEEAPHAFFLYGCMLESFEEKMANKSKFEDIFFKEEDEDDFEFEEDEDEFCDDEDCEDCDDCEDYDEDDEEDCDESDCNKPSKDNKK